MMTLANNPFAFEDCPHRKLIVLSNIQHHERANRKREQHLRQVLRITVCSKTDNKSMRQVIVKKMKQ